MNNTYIIIGLVAILSIVIYFLFVKKDTTVNESQGAVDTLSQAAVSNTSISKSEADKLGEKALANVSPNDTSANKAIDNLKTAATTSYSTPIPLVASEAAKVKVSIKETAKEEQKRILSESLSPVKEKFKFLYEISPDKATYMKKAEEDKIKAEQAIAEQAIAAQLKAAQLKEEQAIAEAQLKAAYMKKAEEDKIKAEQAIKEAEINENKEKASYMKQVEEEQAIKEARAKASYISYMKKVEEDKIIAEQNAIAQQLNENKKKLQLEETPEEILERIKRTQESQKQNEERLKSMDRSMAQQEFERSQIDNIVSGRQLNEFKNNISSIKETNICPLPDKDKDIKALENILMLLNKDTLWDSLNLPDNVISECKDSSKALSDKYSELSKYDIDIAKLNAMMSEILMRNISPVFARGIKPGKDKTEVETLVTLILLSGNNIMKLSSANKDRLPVVLYDETNNLIKANPDVQIIGKQTSSSKSPSDYYSETMSYGKPPSDELIIARFKYLKDISGLLFDKDIFVYDSSKPCSKYIN
jgi:hypothetical protein